MSPLLLSVFLVAAVDSIKPPQVKISTTPSKGDPVYSHAAVVTNSQVCTNIALETLSEEGSAADAAIAALLCEGVTNPQSMGLGGGFLLTYYNNSTKKVEYLNAREAAPAAASADMFGPVSDKDIATGGLSVAVPGELMGYWALHKKYGRISWYDLFRPAIDLCREGVEVTSYTGRMIAKVADEIMTAPSIKSLLTNPSTGKLYKEGDLMRRPDLADTLEEIALHGPRALYDGKLTEEFVYDIRENGGIITVDDLKSYRAMWYSSYQKNIGPYTVHTVPPPGAGPLLMLVLGVMSKRMACEDPLFWHRLIETWKFAYGYRGTITGPLLGKKDATCLPSKQVTETLRKMLDTTVYNCTRDYLLNIEDVVPEDHGTSHISILAPGGDAISVTSTINLSFGALFVSESTGIILNNQMVDFSIPYHYNARRNMANLIAPNRQPMSSMLPTIVTDSSTGEVRLIIGASGGFKILTATSTVILLHLFRDVRLEEAVRYKRLHHQLRPMVLEYEDGFPDELLTSFIQRGHRLMLAEPNCNSKWSNGSTAQTTMHSCVNAIAVVNGEVHVGADFRRKAVGGGF